MFSPPIEEVIEGSVETLNIISTITVCPGTFQPHDDDAVRGSLVEIPCSNRLEPVPRKEQTQAVEIV